MEVGNKSRGMEARASRNSSGNSSGSRGTWKEQTGKYRQLEQLMTRLNNRGTKNETFVIGWYLK